MFYEQCKGYFVKNDAKTYLRKVERDESLKEEEVNIGFFQSIICSMVSSCLAGLITNPLDLAKLRL